MVQRSLSRHRVQLASCQISVTLHDGFPVLVRKPHPVRILIYRNAQVSPPRWQHLPKQSVVAAMTVNDQNRTNAVGF